MRCEHNHIFRPSQKITISKTTYTPVDCAAKQEIAATSVIEYRSPESITTSSTGRRGPFVERMCETRRSMLQIRYANRIVDNELVAMVVA